ncbi:MAG: outer membrane beta-barrel protein [Chitinophagaceae bacterium]|nr:outer membrane beta-barrel protein [Chitinophagaceae bacterium]
MNKRQFDNIESRIREAAENVSPSFNEEDWKAMNTLLDREFPEKCRRKAIFFWLWPLVALTVAGSSYIIFTSGSDQGWLSMKEITAEKPVMPPPAGNFSSMKQAENKKAVKSSAENAGSEKDMPGLDRGHAVLVVKKAEHPAFSLADKLYVKPANGEHIALPPYSDLPVLSNEMSANNEDRTLQKVATGNIAGDTEMPAVEKQSITYGLDKNISGSVKAPASGTPNIQAAATFPEDSLNEKDTLMRENDALTLTDTLSKQLESTKSMKQETQRLTKARPHGFYLIASGSFANTSVKPLPQGTVSQEYGVGIGYRINNRLSLQTGVYAGKKKYQAGKEDYKFEPGSYYTTVDLKKIDADCYVIDIPVSLRYDFLRNRKYSIYGVAGISSYFMKRETYIYSYTKYGMPHIGEKTYNGNRHLFSIATLSLGYEKMISGRFSLLVEPYIKVPLAGAGEGKVKLHTTGLLLGLKYNIPSRQK